MVAPGASHLGIWESTDLNLGKPDNLVPFEFLPESGPASPLSSRDILGLSQQANALIDIVLGVLSPPRKLPNSDPMQEAHTFLATGSGCRRFIAERVGDLSPHPATAKFCHQANPAPSFWRGPAEGCWPHRRCFADN
jgi:hypothetical protein